MALPDDTLAWLDRWYARCGGERMIPEAKEEKATVQASSDRFVIDGRSSRFTVRAYAAGVLSVMAHNPTIGIGEFSGEVKFAPEQLNAGGLRVAIKSTSLAARGDVSDRDRKEMERIMNQEVLESAKFPEILYESSLITVSKQGDALYAASMDGELSLHGVRRKLPITARVAMQGSTLRASGEFSMRQSDFGIKLVSVAGGAIKLKDELTFSFEVAARRQE
jgi:polyisoprenoid-binding protein YceI